MTVRTFFPALAPYLAANGVGTLGTSLWEEQFPAGASGVMVLETSGPSPRSRGESWGRVQVTSRHTDWTTARNAAWAVHDLLHDKQPLILATGVACTHSRAIQAPTSLGRDEAGMWRFVFNVQLLFSGAMP